jgi:hypothetical protein
LFRIDAQEDGDEDDERADEGLRGKRMSEHKAADDDTEDLATRHDYREDYRSKRLYTVEYEELT